MSKAKNVRFLREIARRWVKGFVLAGEPLESFHGTDLTEEEVAVIEDEMRRIAERITKMERATDAKALVNEYYD